jgi:hypothetical protein
MSILLKGFVLGTGMSFVGFVIYLFVFMSREASQHNGAGTIGVDPVTLIQHVFLRSPLFYAAFLGAIAIGCFVVAYWPSRGIPAS